MPRILAEFMFHFLTNTWNPVFSRRMNDQTTTSETETAIKANSNTPALSQEVCGKLLHEQKN